MLKGLLVDELREVLADGVAKWGGTIEDAANQVIDPLLESTPVCFKCFNEVNGKHPLHLFLAGDGIAIEPTFTWKPMKLGVLDA